VAVGGATAQKTWNTSNSTDSLYSHKN